MSSEVGSRPMGQSPRSIENGGVQDENSTWDESSALLPGREISDTVNPWSKRSLAPGFFWIETGTVSCFPVSNRKAPNELQEIVTNETTVAIFCNVFLSGFDGTITASTYAVIGSSFNAANTISWLTTAYLITTTAFQPLYGRFSDILGRRAMFFTATITFSLGCLGCGLAPNIVFLNLMRGLTGLGGGGLITMATIINSDIIPLERRGMYQAVQNGLNGFGAICGASLGGVIADSIGWRWCFLCQVPISVAGLIIGYLVIENPPADETDTQSEELRQEAKSVWRQIDLSGAVLLVAGLSVQLTALSLGGNQYAWSDPRVVTCFVVSVVLLAVFIWVELKTKALPVMPMQSKCNSLQTFAIE